MGCTETTVLNFTGRVRKDLTKVTFQERYERFWARELCGKDTKAHTVWSSGEEVST